MSSALSHIRSRLLLSLLGLLLCSLHAHAAATFSIDSSDAKFGAVLQLYQGAAPVATSCASPSGTVGTTISAPDAANPATCDTWTLVGGVPTMNGQGVGGTASALAIEGGTVYALGTGATPYAWLNGAWASTTVNPFISTTAPPASPVIAESANGTTVLAPSSGFSKPIYDKALTPFQLFYSPGDEFDIAYAGGGATNWQADHMWYVWGTGPNGEDEVWIQNSVHPAGSNVGVWRNGGWLLQPALPTIPSGGPVLGPLAAAPTSTSTSPPASTTTPIACTSFSSLVQASGVVTLPTSTEPYCVEDIPGSVTQLTAASLGAAIVDGTGQTPAAGKACLDIQGTAPSTPLVIQNLEIRGCTGTSVGCVREDGGRGFDMENDYCHDSNTGAGPTVDGDPITINNSKFWNLGVCPSQHNIYVGVAPVFNFTNSISGDDAGIGCNIFKSRALVTNIANSAFTMNGNGHMDFPNGHVVNMTNSTITLPAGSGDDQMLSYCAEAVDTLNDQVVTLKAVTFDNQNGQALIYLPNPTNCPNAVLDLSSGDNFYKGTMPVIKGWATVKGALTQAAP